MQNDRQLQVRKISGDLLVSLNEPAELRSCPLCQTEQWVGTDFDSHCCGYCGDVFYMVRP